MKCKHNKQKAFCKDGTCKKSQICEHNKIKPTCKDGTSYTRSVKFVI